MFHFDNSKFNVKRGSTRGISGFIIRLYLVILRELIKIERYGVLRTEILDPAAG